MDSIDLRVKAWRDLGAACGLLDGQRDAEDEAFEAAYLEAYAAANPASVMPDYLPEDRVVLAEVSDAGRPLAERLFELVAYHNNFVPTDLLLKELRRDEDGEDEQLLAQARNDLRGAYCSECGAEEEDRVIVHAGACPEKPITPM